MQSKVENTPLSFNCILSTTELINEVLRHFSSLQNNIHNCTRFRDLISQVPPHYLRGESKNFPVDTSDKYSCPLLEKSPITNCCYATVAERESGPEELLITSRGHKMVPALDVTGSPYCKAIILFSMINLGKQRAPKGRFQPNNPMFNISSILLHSQSIA